MDQEAVNTQSQAKDATIESRIKQATTILEVAQQDLGIRYQPYIDFPRYKILPDEVQLAMAVIKSHGGEIKLGIVETIKEQTP